MEPYTLKWPVDFDDYSWEIEAKGWFGELEIIIGNTSFKPNFYDPTRLMQDMAEDLASCQTFTVTRLIVIDRVCRELMESAILKLSKSGELERLLLS